MYLTRTNDSQFIMIFFEIIIAVNDKMPGWFSSYQSHFLMFDVQKDITSVYSI